MLSLLISQGYPEISQWYIAQCDEIRVNGRKSSDGKSGLEVLMLLIERGLNPSMDESQRILSGPLIADLVQKVSYTLSFNLCCHSLFTLRVYGADLFRQAERFNLISQYS